MILKNTSLGLTIMLCSVIGGVIGFLSDSKEIGLVLGVAIGIIIGNMPNRNNQ